MASKFLDLDGLRHYNANLEKRYGYTITVAGQTLKLMSKAGTQLASVEIPTQTYNLASGVADGLMSSAHFTKVEGIAEGATKTENSTVNGNIKINGAETPIYKHPTSAAGALGDGLYKITTDVDGHVIAGAKVAKSDITALGIPAQDTTYTNATAQKAGLMSSTHFTKLNAIQDGAQVNVVESVSVNGSPLVVSGKGVNIDLSSYAQKSEISGQIKYMGSVKSYADLPSSGQVGGHMYNVEAGDPAHNLAPGTNVVWVADKKDWDPMATTFTVEALTTSEIDTVF